MGSIRTAGAAAVLTAGLLLQQGCAARKPAPRPPSQPSLGASQQLRSELMRADPNARIGFVTQVLPDAQLVAVRDVPVEDFARGDTVNFLDGNGQPLTTGTVERVLNGAVHISYDAGGTRAPMPGDLAVRTGSGAGAPGVAGPAPRGGATGAEPAESSAGGAAMPGDDARAGAGGPGATGPRPQPMAGGARGATRLPPRRSTSSTNTQSPASAPEPAPADTSTGATGARPSGRNATGAARPGRTGAPATDASPTAPDAAAPGATEPAPAGAGDAAQPPAEPADTTKTPAPGEPADASKAAAPEPAAPAPDAAAPEPADGKDAAATDNQAAATDTSAAKEAGATEKKDADKTDADKKDADKKDADKKDAGAANSANDPNAAPADDKPSLNK